MALPKTGITTSMVAQELGTSSRNVGALCTHSNINMWSRMKPVHIQNNPTPDRNSTWWRGTNNDCGISTTNAQTNSYINISGLYTADKKNGYLYTPSYGDSRSPHRLADFGLYKHDAKPQVMGMWMPPTIEETKTVRVDFLTRPDSSNISVAGDLDFKDMLNMPSGVHMGMVVYDNTTGRIAGRSSAELAGVGQFVDFKTNSLFLNREYTVWPFMCKNYIAQEGGDIDNIYYTIPGLTSGTFKVVYGESEITITCTAQYEYDGQLDLVKTHVLYTYKVYNEGIGRRIANNRVMLRFVENDPSAPLQAGEQSFTIDTFDIQPNSTHEIKGAAIVMLGYGNRDFYLYLTLDGGTYTNRTYPMAQNPQV